MHTETDVVRSSPHCSDDIAKFENVVAGRIYMFRNGFNTIISSLSFLYLQDLYGKLVLLTIFYCFQVDV